MTDIIIEWNTPVWVFGAFHGDFHHLFTLFSTVDIIGRCFGRGAGAGRSVDGVIMVDDLSSAGSDLGAGRHDGGNPITIS